MSEQTKLEMRYRLHIQRGVDERLNTLIENARKLLDGFVDKRQGGRWGMENNQLSNLLGVCGETESTEVVIGYIQYQIGRDDKHRNNWAWNDFGEALIKEIRNRRNEAKALVQSAMRATQYELKPEAVEMEIDQVWILLVRLYTGHLRRYFIYKK